MNEEEVKATIILPWLAHCGVPADQLSFETTLRLRIGRQTCTIEPSWTQFGRLDVLVRRNGQNLLVIEVKRADLALTDADRDQAISYARLVHPIAPLALVTNGTDFRLFDSVSQLPITPTTATFDDGYTVVLPEKDRIESLRLFFSCSPANLLAFCRAQVALETQSLVGAPSDYNAPYIPALQVDRSTQLMPAVEQFLTSDRSMFVLGAEAAMGKTCAMIDVARALLDRDIPTVFLRGAMLESDILDAINNEVEWTFGRTSGSIDTLQRLASSASVDPLLVVVDGIDDWTFPARVQHLASLAARVPRDRVRLLVSCKTDTWATFLHVRGTPTGIESHVFRSMEASGFSLELPALTDRAFVEAVKKCRSAFPGPGAFEETAWTEARRNAFLLRLLFQVAAANGGRFLSLDETFFALYFDLVLQKTSQPDLAAHTVDAIANLLFETNQEWVTERQVRERLHLGPTETILPDLFAQRILTAVGSPGLRTLAFGFAPFRNYVTAFRARNWPNATAEEFQADIGSGDSPSLRAEIAAFYYPFASSAQKAAVDGSLREKALAFLRLYVGVLKAHFDHFRDQFAPYTREAIGFVAQFSISKQALGFYGFRQIEPPDEEVLFVPASADGNTHTLRILKASRVHYHSATNGFQSIDITREVLEHEVCPQLREIVEKGRLNDAATPALAVDVIRAAVKANKSIFGELLNPSIGDFWYPVALADIETAFRRELLRRHFENELVELKRTTGEIKEVWHDGRVSFGWTRTRADQEAVRARVDAAIASGEKIEFNATYVDLEKLWRRLGKAVKERMSHGPLIDGPTLPLLGTLRRPECDDYEAFRRHCKQVLEVSIDTYRRLVEHNLPTLLNHLQLYNRQPFWLVLVVAPAMLVDRERWGLYYMVAREGLTESKVSVYDENEVSRHGDELRTPDGSCSSLAYATASANAFLDGPWVNGLELDAPGSVIRRWVYRWLHADIRRIERALLVECGVTDNPR